MNNKETKEQKKGGGRLNPTFAERGCVADQPRSG